MSVISKIRIEYSKIRISHIVVFRVDRLSDLFVKVGYLPNSEYGFLLCIMKLIKSISSKKHSEKILAFFKSETYNTA